MPLTRRDAIKTIGCAVSAAGLNPLPLLSQIQPLHAPSANTQGTVFSASKSILDIPRSRAFRGIEWLSEQVPYPEPEKRGDTFPVTWAGDDNIYTSAGDPVWPDKGSGLDVERLAGPAPSYHIERVNLMKDYSGWGGCGPKPTGLISVHGVLYLAFQNMTGCPPLPPNALDIMATYGHGYDAQIVQSLDFGKTWTPNIETISRPMFPGRTFGAPAFINFGKDNFGARDNFVYAISGEGWDNGAHLRLGRVPANEILNAGAWQWVSALHSNNKPDWSTSMAASIPVLTHPGYLGCVDMVYVPKVRRYLVLSWHHKVKCNPDAGSELIMYDSPEPWGPFTLVHHEDPWGSAELNPYNPRLPLKWLDPVTLEGWMLFSGSWRDGGKTPYYRTHVRRFRLLTV